MTQNSQGKAQGTNGLIELRRRQALSQVMPGAELKAIEPLLEEIQRLKAERHAVILAHNYQTPDIFHGIADITGDSLALAQKAVGLDAERIILCGVHFMAETAKLLNPERRVLIPDLKAGCSLAESITAEDIRVLRRRYPGVPVVAYVNTSAEVKAEVDVCCTSGNAVEIVDSLPGDAVIFLPDEYLGKWVASQTDKEVILWNGHCEVHERFTADDIRGFRRYNPDVAVVVHPECPPEVIAEADFVGSTAKMIQYVATHTPPKVALITECSMSDNVAAEFPELEFIRPCNLCPHMKRISLEKVRHSLVEDVYEVTISEEIAARARRSVEAMLALTSPKRLRPVTAIARPAQAAEPVPAL